MNNNVADNLLIEKLISENAAKATKDTIYVVYVIAALFLLVALMLWMGIFSADPILSVLLVASAAVFIVVGIVGKRRNSSSRLMRNALIIMLLLAVFAINILTGYKTWLLYSVPIVLSCRYYDRRFTIGTGLSACVFAVLTSFANAYLSPTLGLIDLNTVSFSQPGSISYYAWLFDGVLKHGYDADLVLYNSLKLATLPSCMTIILLMVTCCKHISDANAMLMESYRLAEQEQESIRMRYHATHDELTGLLNRRAMNELFDSIESTEGSCGVIFSDLNGLKHANDTYGHQAGDKLLLRFRDVLLGLFRENDVYRISGDEFICVMTDVTEAVFMERVAALRSVLAEEEPPLACLGATFGKNQDVQKLMTASENEMYAEKEIVHERYPVTRR